jgi:hypothetical protein
MDRPGDRQLLPPRRLQPADASVQDPPLLLVGNAGGRVGGDLPVGRLPQARPVAPGTRQQPEGLLGLLADSRQPPLGTGQHLREAVQGGGDLPEGAGGGVQVRGQLGPGHLTDRLGMALHREGVRRERICRLPHRGARRLAYLETAPTGTTFSRA